MTSVCRNFVCQPFWPSSALCSRIWAKWPRRMAKKNCSWLSQAGDWAPRAPRNLSSNSFPFFSDKRTLLEIIAVFLFQFSAVLACRWRNTQPAFAARAIGSINSLKALNFLPRGPTWSYFPLVLCPSHKTFPPEMAVIRSPFGSFSTCRIILFIVVDICNALSLAAISVLLAV